MGTMKPIWRIIGWQEFDGIVCVPNVGHVYAGPKVDNYVGIGDLLAWIMYALPAGEIDWLPVDGGVLVEVNTPDALYAATGTNRYHALEDVVRQMHAEDAA